MMVLELFQTYGPWAWIVLGLVLRYTVFIPRPTEVAVAPHETNRMSDRSLPNPADTNHQSVDPR